MNTMYLTQSGLFTLRWAGAQVMLISAQVEERMH